MTSPILEAHSLHKWFPVDGKRSHLLKGINLTIDRGTSYAIIGRSGAGKTTLLQLLATLDTPSSGTLSYNGKNVKKIDQDELRNSHFGFVFQSFYLLEDRSVYDNVVLPYRIANKSLTPPIREADRAFHLLERCRLHNKRGVKAAHLSGGEKQRVAIARALFMHPKILFLDEPTGALDKENEEALIELIFQTAREEEASLLLITHNDSLAKRAQHRFLLEDGQLISKK